MKKPTEARAARPRRGQRARPLVAGGLAVSGRSRLGRNRAPARALPLRRWAKSVVRRRCSVLRDELTRLLKKPDEDAIHDVRVASRRLRAALRHLEPCFPPRAVNSAAAAIRSLASLLGQTRDTDILMQNLEPKAGQAILRRWKAELRRRRSAQLRRAMPAARVLLRRLPFLERSLLR